MESAFPSNPIIVLNGAMSQEDIHRVVDMINNSMESGLSRFDYFFAALVGDAESEEDIAQAASLAESMVKFSDAMSVRRKEWFETVHTKLEEHGLLAQENAVLREKVRKMSGSTMIRTQRVEKEES